MNTHGPWVRLGAAVLVAGALLLPAQAGLLDGIGGGGATCDPSRQSCSGGGGDCTPLKQALGQCPPSAGGGGSGGGSCQPNPSGNPGCGGSGPANQGGGSGGGVQIGGGNPINLLTGNKHQQEVDLAPLPGLLGLELKRHYNSRSGHAGLLGPGWRMSYETVLYDLGNQLQIVQADGERMVFQRAADATALCTSPNPGDGQVRIEDVNGQRRYHWRWPDGRTLMFAGGSGGGHPLHAVTAASGEQVLLTYSPAGDLLQVRDPQGRKLIFIYSARGLQAVDTPLGRISYTRDAQGRLVQVAHRTDGSGAPQRTRVYHYENRYNGGHPNALTGISVLGPDPLTGKLVEQRLSTYAYDRQGQAILSTKGHPREFRGGQQVAGTGIEQIELQYVQRALPRPGRVDKTSGEWIPGQLGKTLLTNGSGARTEVLSAVIGGHFRLIEMRGPGCATCGPGNMRYAYDAAGRLLRATKLDDAGRAVASDLWAYDAEGRLARVGWRAEGRRAATQWRERYEYADVRYKDGSVAVAPAPSLIARPSVIPGKEHTVRIAYNAIWQPASVTEDGFSPVDAAGRPSPGGTPIRRSIAYGYSVVNGRSVLTRIDGPLPNGPKGTPEDSDVTLLRYDERGDHLAEIQYPLGLNARFERDPLGRLASYTPADGVAVQIERDSFGQPVRWRRGSALVTISWDTSGRPVRLQRNDGHAAELMYDAGGRIQAVVGSGGLRREVERDSEGHVLKAFWRAPSGDSLFEPERYEYDAAGRRVQEGGTRIAYDLLGRQVVARDVLGRELRFGYDDLGRLSGFGQHAPGLPGMAAPQSAVTAFLYNGSHREPAEVVVGNGATTAYKSDDFGRTVSVSSPDSGERWLRHDPMGRLVESVDAAGTRSRFVYDLLGRLLSRTTEGAGQKDVARWRYEGPHLAEAGNEHQWTRYRRDAEGRVTEQSVELAQAGQGGAPLRFVTRYRYDEAGRLVEKLLPDRIAVLQSYGADGQPGRLVLRYPNGQEQVVVETVKGDAAHGLRELALGNGTVTGFARDRRGNVEVIAVAARRPGAASKPVFTQRITRDEAGRIVAAAFDGEAQRFAYDGFDRLVEEQGRPTGHRRYAYDAVGNRTAAWEQQHRVPGLQAVSTAQPGVREQLTYASRSNRLLETSAHQAPAAGTERRIWSYAANGQPTAIGPRGYRHGPMGRLVEVSQDGRILARYGHNAEGERVRKITAAGVRYYLYAQGRVVGEADEQGRIDAHYVYFGDAPVAKVETRRAPADDGRGWADVRPPFWRRWLLGLADWAGQTADGRSDIAATRVLYLHTNHLGTPMRATDAAQTIVWRADHSAFGVAAVQEDPDGDGQPTVLNLRLPGQYFDAETGTHDNHFRDYDPALGRYLQSDPMGLAGGTNGYAYAEGNPVSHVDPLGLYTMYWGGAGLNGGYIADQVQALRDAGIVNVHSTTSGGSGNTILDANAVINLRVYPPQYGYITPRAPYDADPDTRKMMCPEQANYIGYSYGSLLAAQTAMYWASRGRVIDNLVLIGAPIDQSFLDTLRNTQNIRHVIVIDLTSHDDPLYAGMSELALVASIPKLAIQMGETVSNGSKNLPGVGHFWYANSDPTSHQRRVDLANSLYAQGLR